MPEPEIDEALLILARSGSRSRLQSADIILGDAASVAAAVRWIDATFTAYPGCAVAGACHHQGIWALFATRTESRMLVCADRTRLRWRSIVTVARTVYDELMRP